MKKFFKILGIIILVLIILVLIHTLRNYLIISKLQNRISEYSNSTNYHVKSTSTIAENDVHISIDYYKKDDKSLQVLQRQAENTVTIKRYGKGKKINTYIITDENKTMYVESNSIFLYDKISNQLETTELYEKLLRSGLSIIYSKKIDGKSCYVVTFFETKLYIDKENGLLAKSVMPFQYFDYKYDFNDVEDSIFVEPDINEYTIQGNNIVTIKNNKIQNENLIDKFIEKTIDTTTESQELNIKQDDVNIKITYTPGEYAKAMNSQNSENSTKVPLSDGTFESNKKIYGYYTLIVNEEVKGEYPLNSHTIRRTTSSDKVVTLYFDSRLIDYKDIQEICKYDLDSSNYNKKFDLSYNQRKDLGIKNVYDADMYSVKTFGGDVDIIIEDDMVYSLENALSKKVITPDDILKQTTIDYKYGICEEAYYSDGGSVEYMYNISDENKYTILKLNTLENEKDLIIGMSGQIINIYNNNNK